MPMMRIFAYSVTKVLLLAGILSAAASAQVAPVTAPNAAPGLALYRDLLNPVFEPSDVYRIREVNIQREDLHLSLSDGTIAVMRAVDGHITGAVFDGEGEVLLVPPSRSERVSLGLFTASGVLEETFRTAY